MFQIHSQNIFVVISCREFPLNTIVTFKIGLGKAKKVNLTRTGPPALQESRSKPKRWLKDASSGKTL